ncbi:hypothetical protein AMTRI_Chr12g236640 [Amborella trichopoda]|uniref:Homeobox domain-containing protein n=1 Tax=Amborella trichopoda TaxID=13333 RepID=W1PKC3_AMBTC|nr:homeobox-leucine zipper protein HAT22 [Amborella trichopoda]ERN10452.1 hypothetical protein AMTR_s00026p00233150 [Amborella trichopoda]|eukprot:XP_006848871.1 homeobox-leucine zipper protein HAT22 [Amborella trichopoda]
MDDFCNTGLVLGLGRGISLEKLPKPEPKRPCFRLDRLFPSPSEPCLTLALTETPSPGAVPQKIQVRIDVNKAYEESGAPNCSPTGSSVSSFSNLHRELFNGGVKREREQATEELEVEKRVSDEEEEGNARKKLRLTKEQSALLEDSFKEHSTLNPKQKQALAEQLNLRPRQVEVWFQNRRARTKLKQTEVDCEFLKRCCETLTDENRRLQKELQELKALKFASPVYMQLPAATLTMCPSCERIGAGDASTRSSFAKAAHFFSGPFTHPAAC